MQPLKPKTGAITRLAPLVIGDLLVILSFVWIGRSSHSLSVNDIGASLYTALPFILSWFLVTPWFGLYKTEVNQNWRRLVPRLLLAWVIAGPLALVLRALLLGRPLMAGILPTFAAISLSYIGLVALVWRLGYAWQRNRRPEQSTDMGQARG
jgi:hypothetical protein